MPDIQVRDPGRDRHKRWLAAAAAVIGLALAVERLTARSTMETRFLAVQVPPPAAPKPAPAAEVSADVESLFKLFQEAEAVPGAAPVVAEFAKEFKKEPVLEKELKDFEEPPAAEPKEDLKAFVHNLADKPEFRALVSRFAQDPGFRQVALQLSAHPEIRDVIREVLAKAKAERASMRSSTKSSGAGLASRKVASVSGRGGGPGAELIAFSF